MDAARHGRDTGRTPTVVLLTGVYQNAGDALIADRALAFARWARRDLRIIEVNRASDPREAVELTDVRVCIVTGGPHWQADMRPRILPRIEAFMDAGVPITSWGGGWRSLNDAWPNQPTLDLLAYIRSSGLPVGVRDDYTADRLGELGIGCQMIGCPAWLGPAPGNLHRQGRRLVVSASPKIGKSQQALHSLLSVIEAARGLDWSVGVFFQHALAWYQETASRDFGTDIARIRSAGADILDSKGQLAVMREVLDSASAQIGWRLHSYVYATTCGIPALVICEDERAPNMAMAMGFPVAHSHHDALITAFLRNPKRVLEPENTSAFRDRLAKCQADTAAFWQEL